MSEDILRQCSMRAGYHLLRRRNQHLNFPATTALKISIRALPPPQCAGDYKPHFFEAVHIAIINTTGACRAVPEIEKINPQNAVAGSGISR